MCRIRGSSINQMIRRLRFICKWECDRRQEGRRNREAYSKLMLKKGKPKSVQIKDIRK